MSDPTLASAYPSPDDDDRLRTSEPGPTPRPSGDPRPWSTITPEARVAARDAMSDVSMKRLARALEIAQFPDRADQAAYAPGARGTGELRATLGMPTTVIDGQEIPAGLGVPTGYMAEVASRRPWAELSPTRQVLTYGEADALAPAMWTVEERGRLQMRLVRAGVLAGDFKAGSWDPATQGAYTELLAFANAGGMTAAEALVDYQKARRWAADQGVAWGTVVGNPGGDAGGGFKAPVYRPPDPVELGEGIRSIFRDRLGRDPEADEVEDLTGYLQSVSREAFDLDVDAARMEAAGPTGAPPAGNVFDEGFPVEAEAEVGEVASVDPVARFEAEFQRRYQPEQQFREDVEDTGESRSTLMQSITGMGAM